MIMAALLLCFLLLTAVASLRVQTTVHTSDFFVFLAKFGFEKTDLQATADTQGFIYGNVTLSLDSNTSMPMPASAQATLAVLDRGYFLELYGNRSLFDKRRACSKMFAKVDTAAYHPTCNPDGEQDFIREGKHSPYKSFLRHNGSYKHRSVPCEKGQLCSEEDNPANVASGHQLTFRIRDFQQSRFWYVSLISCHRNETTCAWEPLTEEYSLLLDLWLVNGNPESSGRNGFRYQYSYDEQDLFAFYLGLLFVYALLLPTQAYANCRQRHPITRLLLGDIGIEFIALLATSGHHVCFSTDGVGLPGLESVGDLLEVLAQSLFMLLLLLLAMGWAVTRQELRYKGAIFAVWLSYVLLHCLLYIWKKTEVDVIEDIDEYQTVPGMLILILRIVVMATFVMSLRETMQHEFSRERVAFFLHFGAASLVWFSYLPLMAGVATQISALWRAKFIVGVTRTADTFANGIMVHLLWPTRAQQYFLLAPDRDDSLDELDELCESANHVQEDQQDHIEGQPRSDSIPEEDDNNDWEPAIFDLSHQEDNCSDLVEIR